MEAASTHPADRVARFEIGLVRCADQQLAQAACLGAERGACWTEPDNSLFDEKREKQTFVQRPIYWASTSTMRPSKVAATWPIAVPFASPQGSYHFGTGLLRHPSRVWRAGQLDQ